MHGSEQNQHWLTLFPPRINVKNLNSPWIWAPVCRHVHVDDVYCMCVSVLCMHMCVHAQVRVSMQMRRAMSTWLCVVYTCMEQELHSQNQSRVEERERGRWLTNSINKVTCQGNCQAHNINQNIPQPVPQAHFLTSIIHSLSVLC